ncbi:hypothetical protein [Lactococcus protaetiae]|nr:hypothetical protein [Lactococcus protaetiae]
MSIESADKSFVSEAEKAVSILTASFLLIRVLSAIFSGKSDVKVRRP